MAATEVSAIIGAVAATQGLDRKVEALILGLSDRLRSASNDQNVQRLARDLRAAAPAFVEAIAAEAGLSTAKA